MIPESTIDIWAQHISTKIKLSFAFIDEIKNPSWSSFSTNRVVIVSHLDVSHSYYPIQWQFHIFCLECHRQDLFPCGEKLLPAALTTPFVGEHLYTSNFNIRAKRDDAEHKGGHSMMKRLRRWHQCQAFIMTKTILRYSDKRKNDLSVYVVRMVLFSLLNFFHSIWLTWLPFACGLLRNIYQLNN